MRRIRAITWGRLAGAWPAAWWPVPLFAVAILALWGADVPGEFNPPGLLLVLNFTFTTLGALFVASLMTRLFVERRELGLLFLGSGAAIWGAAAVIAGRGSPADPNTSVTIYNVCVFVAAVCHLLGTAMPVRAWSGVRRPHLWLWSAYGGSAVVVAAVTGLTRQGWVPVFFVAGQGGTPVRHWVLGAAISLFLFAAVRLVRRGPRRMSRLYFWYAPALALLAVGLFGVLVQTTWGSALGWTGRAAQLLAGGYLIVAALMATRRSRVWGIVLEPGLAVALAILVAVAWDNYRNVETIMAGDAREKQSMELLLELDKLEAAVFEAEAGLRDYVITEEAAPLRRYTAARGMIERHQAACAARLPAPAAQQLDTLLSARLRLMGELVTAPGRAARGALIRSGRPQQFTTVVVEEIGRLRTELTAKVAEWGQRERHETRRALHALVAGGVVAGGLVLAIFIVLQRQIAKRFAAEAQLQRHEKQLEELVNARTAELRESVRRHRVLFDLTSRLPRAKTVPEICDTALDTMLDALRCDRAAILLFDAGGVLRFVGWRGLSEAYRQAVAGHSPWAVTDSDPQAGFHRDVMGAGLAKPLRAALRAEGIAAVGFVPLVVTGQLIGRFMTYYNARHDPDAGEQALCQTMARYVAARLGQHRAEVAQERLSRFPGEDPAPVLRLEEGQTVSYANPAAQPLLAQWRAAGADLPVEVRDSARRVLASGTKETLEVALGERVLEAVVVSVRTYVNLYFFDITDRKQAEQALAKLYAELDTRVQLRTSELRDTLLALQTELNKRQRRELDLAAAFERERQRLGRELHEDVAQQLSGLGYLIESLPVSQSTAGRGLDRLQKLIAGCVDQTRHLATGFYPVDLPHLGLAAALQELALRTTQRHPTVRCGVAAAVRVTLPAETTMQLFRIAQEAVELAVHAAATEIGLELAEAAGQCTVTIRSNAPAVPAPSEDETLTTAVLQHRAEMIRATLQLTREAGGGLTICCAVPWSPPQPGPARVLPPA